MSIIEKHKTGVGVLLNGFFSVQVDTGIICTLNRTEIIHSVKTNESITGSASYMVTAKPINSGNTEILFQRTGNTGQVQAGYILKEYTVASGAIVDRDEANLAIATTDIGVVSRNKDNRYVRCSVRCTTNYSLTTLMLTFRLTADDNIQFVGNVAAADIIMSWQTVYIPDQLVSQVAGSVTGISYDVDISVLNYDPAKTFCITSMQSFGNAINPATLKGCRMTSNTNLNFYSQSSSTQNIVTQLVYRPDNKIQRKDITSTIHPFDVVFNNNYVETESVINTCTPYNYCCTVNNVSIDGDRFLFQQTFNNPDRATYSRNSTFVDSVRVVSELIELDGASGVIGTPYYYKDEEEMKETAKDTATVVRFGPIVDETDFKTPYTGTINASDIKISKDGATSVNSNFTSINSVGNGFYTANVPAGDVNFYGILYYDVVVSGQLIRGFKLGVITQAMYYNKYILSSGNDLNSDVREILGVIPTNLLSEVTNINNSLPAGAPADPIAAQSDVSSLSNNTRISISIAPTLVYKTTGECSIPVHFYFSDEQNQPEDPDNNEVSVRVRDVERSGYVGSLYDNEDLTNPATVSTKWTPSYYKLIRVAQGIYKTYLKQTDDLGLGVYSFEFKLEENAVELERTTNINIVSSASAFVDLNDNDSNKLVLAKAIKNYDASAVSQVADSIHEDLLTPQQNIQSKLPTTGLISNLALSDTVDSITLEGILTSLLARTAGRTVTNTLVAPDPVTGLGGEYNVKTYRRDNLTLMDELYITDAETTRLT